MRQESMFESFITSYASAAGLLQVMPGTGGYIAGQLGQSRYDPADLYRPDVSVRFGVFYLAEQRGRFDGHVYAMLAAYNAGPGRSARWYNQSGQADPDLFLALVDIDQPRGYIEAIYLNHALYRAIYGVR
jgi:soluble lytic murein transglycosylase